MLIMHIIASWHVSIVLVNALLLDSIVLISYSLYYYGADTITVNLCVEHKCVIFYLVIISM